MANLDMTIMERCLGDADKLTEKHYPGSVSREYLTVQLAQSLFDLRTKMVSIDEDWKQIHTDNTVCRLSAENTELRGQIAELKTRIERADRILDSIRELESEGC